MDKIQRLKDEVREANEVMRTASGDYERWLDIEHEHRLDQIFTEEPPFTRACRYDGHPILVALGKEFCGDECRSKYRQFDGVWFPQCETCGRYFVTDAEGHADAVRPIRDEYIDDHVFCSPRCLLGAKVDVDDWPAVDAGCWQEVIYVPGPPMTARERSAKVRREILAQVRRRQSPQRRGSSPLSLTSPMVPVDTSALAIPVHSPTSDLNVPQKGPVDR